MKLTSSVFENNANIPRKYTCQGDGINPPLFFEEVPETTQSLALIVDDPDAPVGTWVHWTLWDLPANTKEIPEAFKAVTPATEGLTSFGDLGYGGPCPPSGSHRYFFKVYALNQMLNLKSGSTTQELTAAMDGKILDQAQLMGTYQKT